MRFRFTLARCALALTLATSAGWVAAAPITSLPDGEAVDIPIEAMSGGGPFTLAPGVVVTSTSASAVIGTTASYDFGSNGSWSGDRMIGLNASAGWFDIRFDDPISGFLADLNWTTGEHNGNAAVEAYNAEGLLLESLALEKKTGNAQTPGFHGLLRATEDIAFLRFTNESIGLRHLSVTGFRALPEPGTLALAGLALLVVGSTRRRTAA